MGNFFLLVLSEEIRSFFGLIKTWRYRQLPKQGHVSGPCVGGGHNRSLVFCILTFGVICDCLTVDFVKLIGVSLALNWPIGIKGK